MGHDASQRCGRGQHPANLDELSGFGFDPSAMIVRIDFNQRGQRLAESGRANAATACADSRLSSTILEIAAARAQVGDVLELVLRNADRIKNVGKVMAEKVVSFLQGRYGYRAGASGKVAPRHVDRLGGFEVRAER